MLECPEVGMREVVDGGFDLGSFVYLPESLVVDNMDYAGWVYARKFVEDVLFAPVVL
jgi:hypothetical protein